MKIPVRFSFLIPVFIIMITAGCKTTGLTKEQQVKQFSKMNWLVGFWQNVSTESSMTEEWKKENDTLYSGTSTLMMGTDIVYSESITLAPSGKNIYYTLTSISNGKTGKSSFILKKNQGGKIVFEDPGNKEESRISYLHKSKDNVSLRVEGMDNGKLTTEVYNLKRVIKKQDKKEN